MPYRLTVLSLAAVFCVLPEPTTLPAGPAEPEAKQPAIYALVYVGLGKNDPDNAKRIAAALQELRTPTGAVRDPKVKALPIVKDKDPTVKSSSSIGPAPRCPGGPACGSRRLEVYKSVKGS
jgi:hypothetical protein